ncbi:MAG TPA: metal ABC transporter permease [Planctomycetota bacterium]|nr:metal ABC transporter permease [Planctomycetota bacterium]
MSDWVVIFLVGSFVAASCALVGTFLVLRRMALLGDAISHAVLPGIVIAFFISGSKAALPMVIGASAVGVFTVFLVGLLHQSRRLHEDTSIGVVFPALFSIGVILVSRFAGQVDLDLDCVLHGEIAFANLDTLEVFGYSLGARALWVTGVVLILDAVLVAAFYKELKVSSFDPALAASLGFSPVIIHYLLMSAVSVTVVGSFESVGAILVVAMLVVPPATAYLLTRRLSTMLILAMVIGVASAGAGYAFAWWYDGSIAGSMAAAAGAFFVLALLGSPREGLLARAWTYRRLAAKLDSKLLLLHLKVRDALPDVQLGGGAKGRRDLEARFGWRRRRFAKLMEALARKGLVETRGDEPRLTPAGAQALEEAGISQLAHPE